MVGALLLSAASPPFFLGSAAHAAAAAALPDARYARPAPLPQGLAWLTPAGGHSHGRTSWSIAGGVFRKLLRGDARSGGGFASMHAAIARLAGALPAPPALRLPAFLRLSFGAHELLLEMPALGGREASSPEVFGPGRVLEGVAATIAWLAARGVLYTDLRGPNVLIDDAGDPWLIDFDDCVASSAPIRSLEAYKDAMASVHGAQECNTFASFIREDGALHYVEEALQAAFEELDEAPGGGPDAAPGAAADAASA